MTKAIIFDCDGTLVDSETLSAGVFAELLAEHGVSLGRDALLRRFRGRQMAACLADAAAMLGRALPDDFEPGYRSRCAAVFAAELREIEGATALLESLTVPRCVASNGPLLKTRQSLALTRLDRFFGAHVYSAYEVGSWKPEPGLFLHAAAALGTAARDCLVVEDSEAGVAAARAAGMRVVALHPGRAPEWLPAGVPVIEALAEVPAYL